MPGDEPFGTESTTTDAARDQLTLAREFSRRLSTTELRWSTLTRAVTRNVAAAVGDAAGLFLLSEDGRALDLAAASHRQPGGARLIRSIFSTSPHKPTEGFLRPVIESGEPLFLPAVDQSLLRSMYSEHEHFEYFDRFGVSSLLVAPLASHGSVIGALVVARDSGSPQLDDDDLDFAVDLADRSALALENARLAARHSTSSSAVRDLRALLGAIMRSVVDAVIVIDEHGLVVSINDTSERLLGWPAADLVGKSVDELMPTTAAARHSGFIEDWTRERTGSVVGTCREVQVRRRDGTFLPLEISISEVDVSSRRFYIGIGRDIRDRKRDENVLRRQATLDALTGLVNRASFHRALARAFERVDAGAHVALLFIDLDDFKQVNDVHGHPIGDVVLREVGHRLRTAVRRQDLVARYGGDEFVVLVEAAEDVLDDARTVEQRVRAAFAVPFEIDGQEHAMSCSVGIACAPTDAATISQLVTVADALMYADKSRPR